MKVEVGQDDGWLGMVGTGFGGVLVGCLSVVTGQALLDWTAWADRQTGQTRVAAYTHTHAHLPYLTTTLSLPPPPSLPLLYTQFCTFMGQDLAHITPARLPATTIPSPGLLLFFTLPHPLDTTCVHAHGCMLFQTAHLVHFVAAPSWKNTPSSPHPMSHAPSR